MKQLTVLRDLLGSRRLTAWLSGGGICYYVTLAVWSQEAFAFIVRNLAESHVLRAVYLLLAVNIAIRSVLALQQLWHAKAVFFLRLPLYAGAFLLMTSFFLSLNFRQNTWLLIGQGDVIRVPWEREVLRVVDVRPALEKSTLKTEDSLVFSSEPQVTLLDGYGRRYTVGAFPPRLVGSNYMHVMKVGIGPGVELSKEGKVVGQGDIALHLIPFGTVDKFEVPPSPYTFYLSILPSKVIKKGRETARQYDRERPLYGIEIVKGDKVIAKGETDDLFAFDGIMSIRFHRPSDWVLLDIAYDPFLPAFAAALLLTAFGLLLYPLSFLAGVGKKQ